MILSQGIRSSCEGRAATVPNSVITFKLLRLMPLHMSGSHISPDANTQTAVRHEVLMFICFECFKRACSCIVVEAAEGVAALSWHCFARPARL